MVQQQTRLSETLSRAMTELYKVGGLVLVLLFVGTVLMLVGNLSENLTPTVVGALVVVSCLTFFLFNQLREPLGALR